MPERKTETYIRPDTSNYIQGWSGNGKRTKISGDFISLQLNGMTNDECKGILAKLDPEADVNKYDHLNPGQVRMNIGGRLRGCFNALVKANMNDDTSEAEANEAAQAAFEKAFTKALRKTVDKRVAEWEDKAAARASAKTEKDAEAA